MSDYIAKTDTDWVEFLIEEGITDNVNFWSPSARALRNDLPNNNIYFFSRGTSDSQRKVAGYGKVREFVTKTIQDAWESYRFGNGAVNLSEMLQKLKSLHGRQRLSATSMIGNTIVDGIVWFDQPLDLLSVGIKVAPSIMRGRSTSPEEETLLMGSLSLDNEREVLRRQLADLNRDYVEASPALKTVVSKKIERNPLVVRNLRKQHPSYCQYCGGKFFWKKGRRTRYSEVHHVLELSKGGS